MKKITLLICLFFVSLSYAQSQSGYYITNAGQRVEGAFLESDFNNASTLKFKSASGKDYDKLDLNTVTEYGIGNDYKAVKYTVQIDVSDAKQDQISNNKEANWQKQTLFLNVIVEGDATLYSYEDGKGTKYFYKVASKQLEPQQLLYRQYNSEALKTTENNKYRQQLYNDLDCNGTNKMDRFVSIGYRKSDLVSIFKEYNKCKNSDIKEFGNDTGKKSMVKYSVFAGFGSNKFNVEVSDRTFTEDKYSGFNAGAELLLMFPSDKFGLFAKAEYESIKTEVVNVYSSPYGGSTQTTTYGVKGGIVNIYVGPRYYFNLTDKNKLYIDAAAVLSIPTANMDGDVIVVNNGQQFDTTNYGQINLNATVSGNFGVGYTYNNKYSIEARVNTNRDFLDRNTVITIKSSRIGINLRYTLN